MVASMSDPVGGGLLTPGVFGPTVGHGKPRSGGPDWLRLGMIAISIVAGLAVLTSGTYAGLIWWELRQVGEDAVVIRPPEDGFIPATPGEEVLDDPEVVETVDRTTILLVGSDSRDGLSDEQLQAIGTEETGTDLTDTIILLQIDPATDAAAMLSFPRDLVVERCNGSRGRINQAYFIGEEQGEGLGPACLVRTIESVTGIGIDHYARVNFAGFVQAVDALGGVSFYIDEPLRDRFSGLDIPAGCVEFDGVTAIQFVRARRLDSDFGRIARQQRFAREMIDKATSVGTLVNPAAVAQLIGAVSDTLETDTEFGVRQMVELVNSVRGISAGTVDARTVPGYTGFLGEASVVYAIEDEAEALYRAFRSGELLPENVGTAGAPVALSPSNVIPIEIDNGSSVDGLAEETAEVLEALGFSVAGTGTAPNYGFDASLILYPPDRQDQAQLLSETLGGIAINAGNGEMDQLKLILGDRFDPQEFAPEEAPDSPSEDPSATPVPEASTEEFVGATLSEVQC